MSHAAVPDAVTYYGRSESSCGYCSSPAQNTSVSDGAIAHKLAPRAYDELINFGWRRSGCWIYKPAIGATCCAPFTIRLKCADFAITKSQQKVLKRFEKFLKGELAGDAEAPTPKKFSITTARSSFVEEEFALWKKYQVAVHGDSGEELRRSAYERFLVVSPFTVEAASPGTPSVGYGAFHQQYRIDGALIAVGVIDVLPSGLSSKYCFWDPEYAHLSVGKLSALKEIEWTREQSKRSPSFEYYYMGYYIHSCRKMRYKAEYSPSEILCPATHRWVNVNDVDVQRRLDAGEIRLTDATPLEPPQCDPAQSLVGLALRGKLMQAVRLYELPGMLSRMQSLDISKAKVAAFIETMREFCDRFGEAAMNVMNLADVDRDFCESDSEDEQAGLASRA